MITKITGKLVALGPAEATLEIGSFEYQVYVPEFVRRQLQPLLGESVSLKTLEYLEGNLQQGRLTPRIVGFRTAAEREFFDAICSVDGVGVKKALRAMVRPVKEVAVAIEEQDVKTLSALPGIGPALAERIVAKLRRKMAKFALMIARDVPAEEDTERTVIEDAFEALQAVGHTPGEAREKIEAVTGKGKKFKSVEDLLGEIYRRQRD